MTQTSTPIIGSQKKRLERRIYSIRRRFGLGHLYLAYHAAILPTLNSELLYRLWATFQNDIHGESLDIPWIAISDLIFSPLCEEVGYELYEMHPFIRDQLLKDLKNDPRFGEKRIRELAQYLEIEARYELDSPDLDKRDLAKVQLWTALVYSSIEEAVHKIAEELSKIDLEDSSEWARMTSLICMFEEPLKEANLDSLMTYVQGMYFWTREEKEKSQRLFNTLPIKNNRLEISGVSLTVPQMESFWSINPSITLNLEEFEFNAAEIEVIPKNVPFGSGWRILRRKERAFSFRENSVLGLDLEMVSIPSGEFLFGYSTNSEEEKSFFKQETKVQAFFMSRYPITQIQWRIISELPEVLIKLPTSPAMFYGPHLPVENINWHEAVEFCKRLSRVSGKPYRLPTELEWEFACKAEKDTPFHFGETLSPKLANYNSTKNYSFGPTGKINKSTTVVGNFNAANSFGLSDMHGNVWEWCLSSDDVESYKDYRESIGVNNPSIGIVRGGSWNSFPEDCLSVKRLKIDPKRRNETIGLRIVLSYN